MSRGEVDGPKGGKWTVPKVDGPAESGRSFDEKWTVLLKVNGPSESGRSI